MVHPILAERRRLALYLLAWLPFEMLLALLLARTGGLGLVPAALVAAPLTFIYAFMCLSAFYLSRTSPVESAAPERTLAIHAAAAGVSAGLWLLIARGLASVIERLSPFFAGTAAAVAREQLLLLTMAALLFLLASAVHYVLLAAERSRDAEKQALELRCWPAKPSCVRCVRRSIRISCSTACTRSAR